MSTFDWGTVNFPDVEWDTEPRVVAGEFFNLADSLEDVVEPAIAAREIIMDDIREHFHQEEAPDGTKWEPWAPSYAPRAQSENIGILRKTDDLYESVLSQTSFPIIGNDVWVNTSTWPDYWRVHQEGGLIQTGKMATQRYLKRRRNEKGAGDHGRIPARPYIGLSSDAEARILVLYHGWFTGQIDIVVSPLTGLAHRRGVGGRIGGVIGRR